MHGPRGSRNLALYPAYVVCLNGFFWFPVFFLYLTDRVGLEGALLLEAIYYLAVVVFEVPSGWVSDRIGRRFALRAAALALGAAYVAFYAGTTLPELAVAQLLLALGFAFNSGTDTAFHYDSLVAVGREDEYGDREERIARLSFAVVGVSALVGGALGAIELRLPYLAAGGLMLGGFLVTMFFERPEQAADAAAPRIDVQMAACVRDLRDPLLRWLFAASVILTVVIHVPYQLYQPYLELLDFQALTQSLPTPLVTGAHAFVAMLIASAISSRSVRLARRFGLDTTVLAALGLGVLLIVVMAIALHPLIALLLMFRSAPRALLQAPMNAAIAPRIPRERRASFLSLQSLAGRLAFSTLLFGLSFAVGDANTYPNLVTTALIAAGCGAVSWIALLVASGRAGTITVAEP